MIQKKILIADDEKEALDIIAKKLREKNYKVSAVTDGKEAVDNCKADKPDLLLLDIAMPNMDGYTVASVLKGDSTLKDIPVIFLTGKELNRPGIERRMEELGAYDYIIKPCAFEDILKKVKEAIG